jgi:hypothetical protein
VDGGSVGEEEEDEESVLKESSAMDGFDGSSSWVGTGTGVDPSKNIIQRT